MNAPRFKTVCELGDRFLAESYGIVAAELPNWRPTDPPEAAEFYHRLDAFWREHCTDMTPLESEMLWRYCGAAARLIPRLVAPAPQQLPLLA